MDINTICSSIKNMFETTARMPAKTLSAILMVCSLNKRPGLSCIISTGKIIESLSKKGIPTETLPDGKPNLMNQLVNSVVCEVFRALKEDANIQVAFGPGSISVTTTGANAGGPVVSQGMMTNFGKGVANIQ